MSQTAFCPSCRRQLTLPESALGRTVRCPLCKAVFEAPGPSGVPVAPPVPPAEPVAPDAGVEPQGPNPFDFYHPAHGPVELQPHRGSTILTLGILSLALFWIPLASWILGYIALDMARRDMRHILGGTMDPAGKDMTRMGRLCANIGVTLAVVWCLSCCSLRLILQMGK